MNHLRRLVLSLCVVLAAPLAGAVDFSEEPYMFQVGLSGELQDSDRSDTNTYSLELGAAYPKVVPSDEPVEEADFVQRVAIFGAVAGIMQMSLDSGGGADFEFDTELYGGQLRLANPQFPLGLEANYTFVNFDDSDTRNVDFGGGFIAPVTIMNDLETTSYGVALSGYVTRLAAVGVEYSVTTSEGTLTFDVGPPVGPFTFILPVDSETTEIALFGKLLVPFQDRYWINLEVGGRMIDDEDKTGSSRDEDNHEFFGGGDFYFNRFFSLGAIVNINHGDDKGEEGATYTGRVRFNYGSRIGVEFEYEQFVVDDDTQGEDETSYGLSVVARF